MRKGIVFLVLISAAVLLVAMAPAFSARPNGVGSGTEQYDCGGSCHETAGSASLSMWASNITPAPGGPVKVLVNASGGQVSDQIFGIMIVSERSPVPSSVPSSDGWTITQDPSGTATHNYYESTTYSGSTTMQWLLTAPSTPGIYTLYARAMHGLNNVGYYEDYVAGVTFVVGNIGGATGIPVVVITSPQAEETVSGTVTVTAEVISNKTILYATLRLSGNIIGNSSSAPFTWIIDSDQYKDGGYALNVTVVDSEGQVGYKQETITISNAGTTHTLLGWVWTMAAGSIAILAWMGTLIVVALMIRRRHMLKGGAM